MSRVSIIIPTFNESATLQSTLRQLTILNPPAYEIIIVDGNSTDNTIEIAKRSVEHFGLDCRVLSYGLSKGVEGENCRSRSAQLNHGAKAATGDILCFLHADTRIPDDTIAVIEKTLNDPAIACGGFISLMSGAETTRWGISLHNVLKTYYAPLLFRPRHFFKGLRLLFGDQVMFCRRSDFWQCGGFDEALPIMEDGDLCLKLAKKGRIQQINRVVHSSDRRVVYWGTWKATAIYLYVGILWGVGVSATYLKQFYDDIR
ncbi:MAG: TIGR04283 family arsenosugar biosynthesis glycosyltransferase [Myxacorys californica WJT36-NPBG1]|jgi:rSAM/selenodomain-associated transferase 2|nr:TIGR04283 family arsenosugar biosynthesis glycosyltransferase [Myxacorys californica WJT36-NPBG1]